MCVTTNNWNVFLTFYREWKTENKSKQKRCVHYASVWYECFQFQVLVNVIHLKHGPVFLCQHFRVLSRFHIRFVRRRWLKGQNFYTYKAWRWRQWSLKDQNNIMCLVVTPLSHPWYFVRKDNVHSSALHAVTSILRHIGIYFVFVVTMLLWCCY